MFRYSVRRGHRWVLASVAACLWGLLCLGALTPGASAGPPVDALLNGGFEDAAVDGRPRHWLATSGTVTRSTDNVRTGAWSAAFRHSQSSGGSLVQSVPVDGQAQYRLEGYCALAGPAHTVQLFITWGGISVTSPNAGPTSGLQFMGTGTVSPPPGAAAAMVGVRFRTDGTEATVHCDDLALLRTDPTPTVSPFTPTMTPSASQAPPTLTPTPSPTSTPDPSAPTATTTPTLTVTATPSPTATSTPLPSTLQNGGFEEGIPGEWPPHWRASGGQIETVAGLPTSGGNFIRFTTNGLLPAEFRQTVEIDLTKTYRFSIRCRAIGVDSVSARGHVRMHASLDGSEPPLDGSLAGELWELGSSYVRLETPVTGRPPMHARYVRVVVSIHKPDLVPGVECDDARLDAETPPPEPTPTVTLTPEPPRSGGGGGGGPTATRTRTPTKTATPTRTGTPSRTPSPTITPTGTPQPGPVVRISEVMFNPVGAPERLLEWIELEYLGSAPLQAEGWQLQDNREFDPLPALDLIPGRLHLIAARPMVLTGDAEGIAVTVLGDQSLGNGLANTGDRLLLRGAAGEILDALSWGDDTSVNRPACPAVAEGHSLQRVEGGSPAACGWEDNPEPSPGLRNRPAPTRTPTPSPTGTLTATPTASGTPTPTASPTPAPTGTPPGTPAPSPLATPNANNPAPTADEASPVTAPSLPDIPAESSGGAGPAPAGNQPTDAAAAGGSMPTAVSATTNGGPAGPAIPPAPPTPEVQINPPLGPNAGPDTLDGTAGREYAQSEPTTDAIDALASTTLVGVGALAGLLALLIALRPIRAWFRRRE